MMAALQLQMEAATAQMRQAQAERAAMQEQRDLAHREAGGAMGRAQVRTGCVR